VPVGRFQLEGLKIPSAALRTSEVGVYVEKEKERTLQVCHAPRLEPWQTRVQHVTVGRRDIYGNINRTFLARRFQLAPSKSNSKHQVNKQSLLIKLAHSTFYYLIEIFTSLSKQRVPYFLGNYHKETIIRIINRNNDAPGRLATPSLNLPFHKKVKQVTIRPLLKKKVIHGREELPPLSF